VARLVRHFIEEPRACSYLPALKASLEYRLMVDVTPLELEALLVRGWRRFGPAYFRPACVGCDECHSIRLDVHRFEPTTSQRRALKRSHRFRVEMGRPRIDAARLELHKHWHGTREDARGWEPTQLTEDEYATQFAFPSTTGREMAWYDGERLVALGLVDVTPNCFSAAYFFYHPDIAPIACARALICRPEPCPRFGRLIRVPDLSSDGSPSFARNQDAIAIEMSRSPLTVLFNS
jgi:arginine-tRNA-protein transferase